MIKSDAIERANQYVLENMRIDAEPIEVHCIQRPEAPVYWWISYGTFVYYPHETSAGAAIDGGEYILRVDDTTGEVSVL
jgi:hypothetical protein